MAGMGPPPAANKRRRNADTFAEAVVTVSADAEVEAPELPDRDQYSANTVRWYDTWSSAPQAAAFTATDWQRLHMIAPLVDAFWAEPSTKLMSEIRLNESLLGATHLDRMRARIKVEAPAPEQAGPAAGVSDLTSRRRRLTDAS